MLYIVLYIHYIETNNAMWTNSLKHLSDLGIINQEICKSYHSYTHACESINVDQYLWRKIQYTYTYVYSGRINSKTEYGDQHCHLCSYLYSTYQYIHPSVHKDLYTCHTGVQVHKDVLYMCTHSGLATTDIKETSKLH